MYTSEYLSFYPFVREYLIKSQNFDVSKNNHISGKEKNPPLVKIDGEDLDKIQSLYVYLFRNIDGYPFASVENNQNEEIENLIKSSLENINSKEKLVEYYSLTENKEEAENIIKENKLIFHCEDLLKGGIDIDYPKNRGIILFTNLPFIFGVVNDICHIKFCISMQEPKDEISYYLTRLLKVNNDFFRYLKFNYNSQIGFMTASPIYLGTGMRVELNLQLKKLNFNDIQKVLNDSEFVVEKNNGCFTLTNKITIGHSETEILCNLLGFTKKIIDMDN